MAEERPLIKSFHAVRRDAAASTLQKDLAYLADKGVASLLSNVEQQMRYGRMVHSPICAHSLQVKFQGVRARLAVITLLCPDVDENEMGEALKTVWDEAMQRARGHR